MNIEDLEYRVAVRDERELVFLDELVTALSWEDAEGQLAARCSFDVHNAALKKGRVAQLLPNGVDVKVFAGDPDNPGRIEERFSGRIFRNGTSRSTEHRHSVVAYDPLFYLMGSEDDRYYPEGRTGKQIITDLAKRWQIPLGDVPGPNEPLGKKMFRGIPVGEMYAKTLLDTRRRGGGRWIVYSDNGRVSTRRRGGNANPWRFETEDIISLDVERSIESLVTVVKIVGREKGGSKTLATATSELAADYGTLQRIVNRADFNNARAAKRAAITMLKEEGVEEKIRTIVAPDVPGLRRGDKVHIKGGTLDGAYIVSSIVHDGAAKTMAFDVETMTDEEVAIEFEETGLWDWLPPEDVSPSSVFKGEAHEALAIASNVDRGPAWVYEKALPAARRAGGGFTIVSWRRFEDSVDGPGVSWHYNGGRALDIVASPLSRLNRLYVELQKERPVELLWQVPDHFDHLHTAWESP